MTAQSWLNSQSKKDDDPWMSVSDLMAGLMVIFLFIAIVYIRPVVETQSKIEEVVSAWEDARKKIFVALQDEFRDDLRIWDAELQEESLTIRFRAPDILFETGTATLRNRFKQILDSFFPRYLGVLSAYQKEIEEIRIEGHTSSEWSADSSQMQSYFKNMELSQARTRSVLEYALSIEESYSKHGWSKSLLTANGLSFSRKLLTAEGIEDKINSRRVEFRVRTNTDQKIQLIIESLK